MNKTKLLLEQKPSLRLTVMKQNNNSFGNSKTGDLPCQIDIYLGPINLKKLRNSICNYVSLLLLIYMYVYMFLYLYFKKKIDLSFQTERLRLLK